ncbi:DUF7109 family protein [Halomicrobium urmianum]|uniref:DUF7109 family protein n=1 Tax=Halomicrobium urmianum TaxID=1586233 RepID=UPI001CD9FCCE|nr:hypothetical protein [Halomicrobium urmianum]
MQPTADELAGVVDLFGALTRAELRRALSELAFKRGAEPDDPDGVIDDAVASYRLVAVDGDDGTLLVVGPAAFPELPEGAEDLPHIMDAPERTIDRDRAGRAAAERFREEATLAVREGDADAVERLLDVSYDLDAWAPVDVAGAREQLRAEGDN